MAYNHNYHYYKQLFSFDKIEILKKDNAIIDGKKGGLLLGPSHDQGGIYFLFEYDDGYRLYGEVEGYEYIINRECAEIYRNHFDRINNRERDLSYNFSEYDDISKFDLIDARSPNEIKYKSKFIILDVYGGFSIINKNSTKRFINELDKMNKGIY